MPAAKIFSPCPSGSATSTSRDWPRCPKWRRAGATFPIRRSQPRISFPCFRTFEPEPTERNIRFPSGEKRDIARGVSAGGVGQLRDDRLGRPARREVAVCDRGSARRNSGWRCKPTAAPRSGDRRRCRRGRADFRQKPCFPTRRRRRPPSGSADPALPGFRDENIPVRRRAQQPRSGEAGGE